VRVGFVGHGRFSDLIQRCIYVHKYGMTGFISLAFLEASACTLCVQQFSAGTELAAAPEFTKAGVAVDLGQG
jgi:hypothetical protein